MKFPYSMLLDFVRTDLSAEQIGDLLTMAGFELEGIEEVEGEPVLDIKVVSNRGDGLSVFGLSREVLAKDPAAEPTDHYRAAASRFPQAGTATLTLERNVATIEAEACRRFAVRAFRGVDGRAQAPDWIQKRLRQAGMRTISLLVDLTNYVMLEVGQPLHAFDRAKLAEGRIVVRHAQPGERLTTLNGDEHTLSGQMMICDAERPVGVPGVMGGLETEVSESTTEVLLESANFLNLAVRKTRRQLGLNTDASYRFERSVDPEGVVGAIHRFSALLKDACPAVEMSNVVDLWGESRAVPTSLRVRADRASRLLGMPISPELAESYLTRLGMAVERAGDELNVTPPSWRPDIVREEDLVEELGRVHGYERIPEVGPAGTVSGGGPQGDLLTIEILREAALRAGFSEVISHSLRAPHALDALPEAQRLGPRVPASPEHSVLRDSMLPGLAEAATRNGGRDQFLFELGRVFGEYDGVRVEETTLGLFATGELLPHDRKGAPSVPVDFYRFKGLLLAVLREIGLRPNATVGAPDSRLHPTRQGVLGREGATFGRFGQLHPDVAESLRLAPETFVAEIQVAKALRQIEEVTYRPISRNPAIRRDITVDVDRKVPFQALQAQIERAAGELLERQWLADVYVGAGVAEGKHALTIGLQLRKIGENFTDEEANQVRDSVVAALGELGATTR